MMPIFAGRGLATALVMMGSTPWGFLAGGAGLQPSLVHLRHEAFQRSGRLLHAGNRHATSALTGHLSRGRWPSRQCRRYRRERRAGTWPRWVVPAVRGQAARRLAAGHPTRFQGGQNMGAWASKSKKHPGRSRPHGPDQRREGRCSIFALPRASAGWCWSPYRTPRPAPACPRRCT